MRSALSLLLSTAMTGASPVATTPATVGPWEKAVTLPAEALPHYRIHLGSSATGWIASVNADIGSRMKGGELLAEIRSPELVAARAARAQEALSAKQRISQAASMLRSAEARAEAAKSESDRITRLANSGTVTSKASDEATARLASALAEIGEAEAGMAAAEAEALAAAARETEAAAALEYTRITAPFDGLVVERHAELGDFLGPASAREKLFVFEQTDPLRIRLQIPEQAAALANVGDPVTIRLSGREIPAQLVRVAGSLDPATRTMTAEAEASGLGILPGAFGTATLRLMSLESATLVPLTSLVTDPDGSCHVLVLDGETPRKVPVTVAAIDGSQAVLSAGPAAGAPVVTQP